MALFFPRHLSIETSNACNRACPWCPLQRDATKGRLTLLNPALLDSLLDELQNAPHPLKITLQWIDEPLLNPQLLAVADKCVGRLPGATWLLQTNGDRLDVPLLAELRRRFHAVAVNLYSASAHQRLFRLGVAPAPGTSRGRGNPGRFARAEELGRVTFNEKYRDTSWVMAHDAVSQPTARQCDRLWTQAAIGFDGAVHVCCRDNLKQHPVGSLVHQSLFEAYNSERAQALRWLMQRRKRHAIAMCVTCPAVFREPLRALTSLQVRSLQPFVRQERPTARRSFPDARRWVEPVMTHAREDSKERQAQRAAMSRNVE